MKNSREIRKNSGQNYESEKAKNSWKIFEKSLKNQKKFRKKIRENKKEKK